MKLLLQSLVERALYIAMLLVVGFNIFIAFQVQRVVHDHQEITLSARKANIARQEELEDYIKCVLLIRYDVPPEQLTTRNGAEVALDACAARETSEK